MCSTKSRTCLNKKWYRSRRSRTELQTRALHTSQSYREIWHSSLVSISTCFRRILWNNCCRKCCDAMMISSRTTVCSSFSTRTTSNPSHKAWLGALSLTQQTGTGARSPRRTSLSFNVRTEFSWSFSTTCATTGRSAVLRFSLR